MIEWLALAVIVGIFATLNLHLLTRKKGIRAISEPSRRIKTQNDDLKEMNVELDRLEVRDLRNKIANLKEKLGIEEGEEGPHVEPLPEGVAFDLKSFWSEVPGAAKPLVNSYIRAKLGFTIEEALEDAIKTGQVLDYIWGFLKPWIEKYVTTTAPQEEEKKPVLEPLDLRGRQW